jgi:hypothetical protein
MLSLTQRQTSLVLLAAGAAILITCVAHAKESAAIVDKDLAIWVDKQVQARQPSADDRRFDQIGWVKDILEARRLSKEYNRPVFLFTHDGRMNIGRC